MFAGASRKTILMGDMEMYLTGEMKYTMFYAQSSANRATFVKVENSRRILAFGRKQ